jgi:hypothetical protein
LLLVEEAVELVEILIMEEVVAEVLEDLELFLV